MADFATRGTLATALYKALGITAPSSTGRFSDAGDLDGIVSTLADLGITNGVEGGKRYGGGEQTTRGQAFTMIARALGLADASTDIATASQALVNAGIVKGYGNDPGNLGLNDPLQSDHLGLLMDRLAPELKKANPANPDQTIGDKIIEDVDDKADDHRAETDPGYAAYLASLGLKKGEIDDEIKLREELFVEDTRRRSETYARATDQAIEGVQQDFENRGLFRSGTRMRSEAEKREQIGYQQEAANYAAQRDHETGLRSLHRESNDLDRQMTDYRARYETELAADYLNEDA